MKLKNVSDRRDRVWNLILSQICRLNREWKRTLGTKLQRKTLDVAMVNCSLTFICLYGHEASLPGACSVKLFTAVIYGFS